MRAAAVLVLIVAACGGSSGDAPDAGPGGDATPRPDPGASLGAFTLTYYWITAEDEFPGAADTAIYDDAACTVLATVPSDFADSLDIEGTGRLADGRVINVSGGCGCARSPCYVEVDADHPWGYGVQDRALEPYRSFAVDRDVIEYGTTLWVAELDGVAMPGDPPWGGFVHDGCVIAADTGGGIVGMHVDWFVGLRASYQALDDVLGLNDVTVHDGGARCPPPP
jgi:3D (Asp-Asp-Asp) domain-containing protein